LAENDFKLGFGGREITSSMRGIRRLVVLTKEIGLRLR
jgi:hypothetical protein